MARTAEPRECPGGCGVLTRDYLCRDCVNRMWDTARRIAAIVQRDPCGGLPELEVQERVGEWDVAWWKRAKFTAYRKRWIGFGSDQARGYMFAPVLGSMARLVPPDAPPERFVDPFVRSRVIEVRLAAAVFTVVVSGGVVEDVAGAGAAFDWLRGMPEADAAAKLKAEGAAFAEVCL